MTKVLIKLITCSVLLTGCAPHILTTPPERDSAVILFKIVDELPSYAPVDSAAVTKCISSGVCEIHILREYYPECVVHEIGHVTHGNWHHDKPMHCSFGSNNNKRR